jgi:hypothetical protein
VAVAVAVAGSCEREGVLGWAADTCDMAARASMDLGVWVSCSCEIESDIAAVDVIDFAESAAQRGQDPTLDLGIVAAAAAAAAGGAGKSSCW